MASMSLETAIRRAGSPVELLRQSPARSLATVDAAAAVRRP